MARLRKTMQSKIVRQLIRFESGFGGQKAQVGVLKKNRIPVNKSELGH